MARPESVDPMEHGDFLLAVERARGGFTTEEWQDMPVSEQSRAIYRELKLIDAETVRARQAATVGNDEPRTPRRQPVAVGWCELADAL